MGLAISAYAFHGRPRQDIPILPPGHEGTGQEGMIHQLGDGKNVYISVFQGELEEFILLYCYGNLDCLEHRAPYLRELARMTGVTIIGFDYPGCGASPGFPTEEGLYETAHDVVTWMKETYPSHTKLILFGRSIGCSIATQLASTMEVYGIVLESPFLSVMTYALRTHYHPLCCLDLYYTNAQRARETAHLWGKLLIIHGKEDTLVPVWHSEEMERICKEVNPETHILYLAGRGHNNITVSDIFITFCNVFIDPS
jgi:hypothetical protein